MSHTQTPWSYRKAKHLNGIEKSQDFGILGPANEIIAETFEKLSWTDVAPAEANAAFICRAVNNFEALVKVLQDGLTFYNDEDGEAFSEWREQARAVLKQAEEG